MSADAAELGTLLPANRKPWMQARAVLGKPLKLLRVPVPLSFGPGLLTTGDLQEPERTERETYNRLRQTEDEQT